MTRKAVPLISGGLDSKIFMVQKAHEWVQRNNFDFIITGEVMGQRPMSQRKKTLPVVSVESGADDFEQANRYKDSVVKTSRSCEVESMKFNFNGLSLE